jgi:aromatic ring-opening dioxygenase LigB subunit
LDLLFLVKNKWDGKRLRKEKRKQQNTQKNENRWFGINLRFSSVFPLVFDKKNRILFLTNPRFLEFSFQFPFREQSEMEKLLKVDSSQVWI